MEPNRKEVIKKIRDYFDKKISRELVDWASKAWDECTDDSIESALMVIWSLHDEWGLEEEVEEVLQELEEAELQSQETAEEIGRFLEQRKS